VVFGLGGGRREVKVRYRVVAGSPVALDEPTALYYAVLLVYGRKMGVPDSWIARVAGDKKAKGVFYEASKLVFPLGEYPFYRLLDKGGVLENKIAGFSLKTPLNPGESEDLIKLMTQLVRIATKFPRALIVMHQAPVHYLSDAYLAVNPWLVKKAVPKIYIPGAEAFLRMIREMHGSTVAYVDGRVYTSAKELEKEAHGVVVAGAHVTRHLATVFLGVNVEAMDRLYLEHSERLVSINISEASEKR